MIDQKFDFITSNIDHIRVSLGGVYFLISGERVLYIGESDDIRRDILNHTKNGKEFDKVGIQLFKGNKEQRKIYLQELIQALKTGSQEEKSAKQQTGNLGHPQKQESTPNIKSAPASLLLGGKPETLQQPGLNIEPKKSVAAQKSTMVPTPESRSSAPNESQDQGSQSIIRDDAKEALRDWTQQITQEALAEMKVEKPRPPRSKPTETIPNWLHDLAEQPLANNAPDTKESASPNGSKPKDALPDWAQPESDAAARTPAQKTAPPKDRNKTETDNGETPEWLKDIDMSKSNPNSVPPFR